MSHPEAHDTDRSADGAGAFVPGPRCLRPSTGHGPLDGLRLAVKDLIDVKGVVTGGGNPDWASTHWAAGQDAPSVSACLAAGAHLVGKTITDELAFSLEGENAHHGTPRNPRAPGHLPGGSSSGSASALACGLADIALGTDTGGSVRIPASFCGLFGMRPTHGRISLDGVIPFAPSYDTVGWFARDAQTLRKLGRVLLGLPALDAPTVPAASSPLPRHLLREAFDAAEPQVAQALQAQAIRLDLDGTDTGVFQGPLSDWLRAYQVLQGAEIRTQLGPWIRQHQPRFGANIAPRFDGIWDLSDREIAHWQTWRRRQAHRLLTELARIPRIWVMPTSPTPPLPLNASGEQCGRFYQTSLALNALAGHLGLPQITLPLATLNGLPLGLSLIAPPGHDSTLLDLAVRLTPTPR